ncbi:hypothetical protein [Streptomyces sp. 8L]|uniref:hypothetical protein n=1 Tax=Streptomyces sp. 8L TaxID=2877242 RepID=UPI001CD1FC0B|nr:hypothetical protein [Streptomyces sp. 8L]MCA1217762.1 hypothetical protein [Streptomyces sp. 8L]
MKGPRTVSVPLHEATAESFRMLHEATAESFRMPGPVRITRAPELSRAGGTLVRALAGPDVAGLSGADRRTGTGVPAGLRDPLGASRGADRAEVPGH